jgi:hypothetical protein
MLDWNGVSWSHDKTFRIRHKEDVAATTTDDNQCGICTGSDHFGARGAGSFLYFDPSDIGILSACEISWNRFHLDDLQGARATECDTGRRTHRLGSMVYGAMDSTREEIERWLVGLVECVLQSNFLVQWLCSGPNLQQFFRDCATRHQRRSCQQGTSVTLNVDMNCSASFSPD